MKKKDEFRIICDALRTSTYGVAKLCELKKISYLQFRRYVDRDSPSFSEENARYFWKAKNEQKVFLADSLITLAGEVVRLTQAANADKNAYILLHALRLQIDTIKWILGNKASKKSQRKEPFEPFPTDLEIVPYSSEND